MPQRVLSPEKLQEIRELVAGWGRIIARRAFGEPGSPDAPADFLAMEPAASVAASALAEGALGTLFDLQARALDPLQPCPDCGKPCPVGTEERSLVILQGGKVALQEPVCHCPGCRRDFFPPPGRPAPRRPRLQPRRDAQDR
jgi:hypothetical protein